MEINSREDFKDFNSKWKAAGEGPWRLTPKGIREALGSNRTAIGVYWIGYADDHGRQESFMAKYPGSSVDSLYARLMKHLTKSSNREVREALARGEELWFRFAQTRTGDLALELEAVEIAANPQYWNDRNEWTNHWAWMEDSEDGSANYVEKLPEQEQPEPNTLLPYPMRRGPNTANPIREPLVEVVYGNGDGTGDDASESNPLFIADGVIFTNRTWPAAQRARMRSSPEHQPRLFRGKVHRLMFGRILDLRSGRAGQQWRRFLETRPERESPTYGEILEQPNQNIWRIFKTFLSSTGRNIENYDTIIRSESLRRSVQYCVREPKRARGILEKLEEVPEPFEIKVLDEVGLVREVSIDPMNPGEFRANLRYITRRNRAEYGPKLKSPRVRRSGRTQPFTYTRAQRVGAAALGVVEIMTQAAEMYELYESLPSRLEVNYNLTVKQSAFWASFGVPSIILAIATSDKVRLQNGTTAKAGTVLNPASDLTPTVLSEASDADLRFFLAFVDNIDMPFQEASVLDYTLSDPVQYMRFLASGRASGSILPPESDAELPLSRIQHWYAVTERPKMQGSLEIIKEYHSLDDLLARILFKVISQEETVIPTRESLSGADMSRTKNNRLAIDRRILGFKNMADSTIYSPLPDILSPDQNATIRIGLSNGWGDLQPRFHQVGPRDVGSPFWIANALLVTGANAETNAFLAGALAEREPMALIQGERVIETPPTLPPEPPDTEVIWIEAPLVYVKESTVTLM